MLTRLAIVSLNLSVHRTLLPWDNCSFKMSQTEMYAEEALLLTRILLMLQILEKLRLDFLLIYETYLNYIVNKCSRSLNSGVFNVKCILLNQLFFLKKANHMNSLNSNSKNSSYESRHV